jgi:hypothetical protein
MKNFIKNNWPINIFIIIVSFFILSFFLGWIIISIVLGVVIFIIICCVIIAWVVTKVADEQPLILTDMRKVEGVDKLTEEELRDIYYKETGRCIQKTMYLLLLPDEKHYIDWLELQATKYLILDGKLTGQISTESSMESEDEFNGIIDEPGR